MRAFSIAAVLILACLPPARAASLPDRVNFQGKLINPATNNPQIGPVSLTFKLYAAASGGTALYSETQSGVNLTNGVFSVQIGAADAIPRDLFLGASAYLGITVVGDAAGEMTPRQALVMSPYAFTAHQLSDASEVRLVAGTAYSTFTAAGTLSVPAGITAASGTFTATGSGQFSLTASSGINMTAGILDVSATSGINAADTGITLSTIDFVGETTDPASGNAGYMYYNSSTGSIKVLDGSGSWNYVFGQSLGRQFLTTTDNTAAVAVNKPATASVLLVPLYLPGPMMVNHMIVDVTTALGAAGDIGIYNEAGTRVLNSGTSTLTTTAAVKNLAPAQTGNARFLPPGQYYAAVTFNSTTGRLAGNTIASGAINRVGSVNGGGTVLPATIAPGAITAGTIEFFFEINP